MIVIRHKLFSAAALMALVGNAAQAQAATLLHDYRLNGSYADALGGPSLTPHGGALGATGYTFGAQQGLSLENVMDLASYSIEISLSMNGNSSTSQWSKILDFDDLTSDAGVYRDASDRLVYYRFSQDTYEPSGQVVPDDTPVTLLMTRDAATSTFRIYGNGMLFLERDVPSGVGLFGATDHVAWFLHDDQELGQTESSTGFINSIRIWSGAILPGEAATPVPEPVALALLVAGGAVAYSRRRIRPRA